MENDLKIDNQSAGSNFELARSSKSVFFSSSLIDLFSVFLLDHCRKREETPDLVN